MTNSVTIGRDIALCEDGYVRDPNTWNMSCAKILAADQGIQNLSEDQLKIIDYLRDYYLRFHIPPPVAMLRKETGFNLESIYKLFPSGLAKSACRVAGLPSSPGLYPQ